MFAATLQSWVGFNLPQVLTELAEMQAHAACDALRKSTCNLQEVNLVSDNGNLNGRHLPDMRHLAQRPRATDRVVQFPRLLYLSHAKFNQPFNCSVVTICWELTGHILPTVVIPNLPSPSSIARAWGS